MLYLARNMYTKGLNIFLEYINIYIIALHTMTTHLSHHFSFYTDILAVTFSHLHCDQASRLPPEKRKRIFSPSRYSMIKMAT